MVAGSLALSRDNWTIALYRFGSHGTTGVGPIICDEVSSMPVTDEDSLYCFHLPGKLGILYRPT